MTDKPKSIAEALAEVQRKVNEERARRVAEMAQEIEDENIEEGLLGTAFQAGKNFVKNVEKGYNGTVGNVTKNITPVTNKAGATRPVGSQFAKPGAASKAGEAVGSAAKTVKNNPGTTAAAAVAAGAGVAATKTATSSTPSKPMSSISPAPTSGISPAPKADAPKADTKTPAPTTVKSFKDTFADARKKAGGAGGKFTYKDKEYQTNVKGEKYKSPDKLKKVTEDEEVVDESAFGSAFAAARKSGKSTFSYGGKSFNTKTKSDAAPKRVGDSFKKPVSVTNTKQDYPDKDKVAVGKAFKNPAQIVNRSGDPGVKSDDGRTVSLSKPSSPAPSTSTEKPKASGRSISDYEKANKISEALISAFLTLHDHDTSNMFVEAKKLSDKQKKIAAVAGDKSKIDADDFKALRAGKKVEEESRDHLGSSTVTKDKKGYEDPSTPKTPYTGYKGGNKAGDIISKAKGAAGMKEEAEVIEEAINVTFSEAELAHLEAVSNAKKEAPKKEQGLNDTVDSGDLTN